MKKILFAGCGSIGRRHIQNLKSLIPCEILAYRVRREPLGDFGVQHGIHEFDDLNAALDERPDAVFVTNPTSLHLGVARAAAARGIGLFIEKPLSHSLAGVDEFLRLCKRKKVPVLMGYKMRFHPAIRKIKELLDAKAVGRVLAAKVQYGGYLPDWHPWEDYRRMYSSRRSLGGGIILDAVHELDYMRWLFGPVRRVSAMGGHVSSLEIDTEDVAELLLEFGSGTVGNVHLNYVQRPEYRACQVIGENGTILWDTLRRSVEWYRPAEKCWESFPEPAGFQANDMFVAELKHFLACLDGKEKPASGLAEERDLLEMALKAQRACTLGPKRKKRR